MADVNSLNPLARSAIVFVMLLSSGFGYYYWINHFNWYPDSFFIKEFEKYTESSLENEAKVIWKWAAPRGGDGSSHYVTASIIAPAFDATEVDARFHPQSDCYESSGGAKQFLTEASSLLCWRYASALREREWFFIMYASDESILLFKKVTE